MGIAFSLPVGVKRLCRTLYLSLDDANITRPSSYRNVLEDVAQNHCQVYRRTQVVRMEEKHSDPNSELDAKRTETRDDSTDVQEVVLTTLGYTPELQRNRSLYTLLFQSLAIVAVPYGEGSALNSAIVGGGQLPSFVGWILVSVLDEAIAMSLAELASKFPTSSDPYFWIYRLLPEGQVRTVLSFITGWTWLVGNWTIALTVNSGMASLIAGTVTM